MMDTSIRINGVIFWLLASFLLVLPLKWVAAALLAALIHEFSHVCMIKLYGIKVDNVRIGLYGTIIETCHMTSLEEFLCALAGPIGSFLLLSTCHFYPELAVCGFIQGLFNLLPVYPLDGGRILRCILNRLLPAYSKCVEIAVAIFTITATFVLATVYIRDLLIFPVLLLMRSSVLRNRP